MNYQQTQIELENLVRSRNIVKRMNAASFGFVVILKKFFGVKK